MNFSIRPYQELAHTLLINAFKNKRTPLVLMPTGTGKTKTMISFMEKYKKFYNFLVIVRQRDLVFQFAAAVDEFGLCYGVFMSGEFSQLHKSIQVSSIDTIHERAFIPFIDDPKDLVILIDEADETVSDKYDSIINQLKARTIGRTFMAGFTATAFDKPLLHFNEVIKPLTPEQARDNGYLIDFDYKIPRIMDLSTIHVVRGEFNNKDVETKFNTPEMIKDSFKWWLELGENRQTLTFTNSKDHANNFCEYINNYYGATLAAVITADTKNRKEIYDNFKNGKLRFLVNIRIVTRGVDIPEIGCILDCALTGSDNMHVQKLGRGSRPNPFYNNCIIIDMANNCVRNGPFYDWERPVLLADTRKKKGPNLNPIMDVCLNCFRASLKNPNVRKCPYCNIAYEVKEKKLTSAEKKKLEMVSANPEVIKQMKMINDFKKILWMKANKRDQYRNNIDKAREAAHDELIQKYGIVSVLKIQNAVGMKGRFLERIMKKHLGDYDVKI